MLNRSSIVSSTIGLGLGLACASLAGGRGAANEPSIGVVDMESIYNTTGRELVMRKTLTEFRAAGVQRLNDVEAAALLTPDERKEYLDLISVEKLTDAQAARAKELKDLSGKRSEELQGLETRKETDMTPVEKQRMRELVNERQALEQVMPGIQEVVRLREEQQTDDLRHVVLVKIRETVAQVAKEKGCSEVFDAAALPFTGQDLTPAVLQKLRSKAEKP